MSEDSSYTRRGHSGASIEINGRFIIINNGYINSTVDYIVIREYAMQNEKERLMDNRYQKNGFMASLKSSDGDIIFLRNTNTLFYPKDDKLETYPINLKEQDLYIIHGEVHKSIDELIRKLTLTS